MNTINLNRKHPLMGWFVLLAFFLIVCVLIVSCGDAKSPQKRNKPLLAYQIEGRNTLGVVVRLETRTTLEEIIIVCSEIRDQYSADEMVTFHFYLPGMRPGISSSYASVFYPTDPNVKANSNALDPKKREIIADFRGLTPTDANKLNQIVLMNPQYKTILGKFIEDYPLPKIQIFYTDSREKKGKKLFIAKYYLAQQTDTPEIIAPLILREGGAEKLIVNEDGDYYVVENNTLCKYRVDGEGKPFYCISGEK